MLEEVLKVKSLSKRYVTGNGIETNALCGVDLCVHKNEMLAVMGRSGSGKSTLINLVCLNWTHSYFNDEKYEFL